MSCEAITGVILAGGLGRRMGGVDKGLQMLDGRPLVSHVIARLAPQVDAVQINANRNQAAYAAFGYPVFSDEIPDFAGPLSGLHAALGTARTPLVLAVPCDSPYLPADLAERLYAGLVAAGSDLAIVQAEGRQHPVFCLARTHLQASLQSYLQQGGRRVAQWCAAMGACVVEFDDQPLAFRNFNTLDDLSLNADGPNA